MDCPFDGLTLKQILKGLGDMQGQILHLYLEKNVIAEEVAHLKTTITEQQRLIEELQLTVQSQKFSLSGSNDGVHPTPVAKPSPIKTSEKQFVPVAPPRINPAAKRRADDLFEPDPKKK